MPEQKTERTSIRLYKRQVKELNKISKRENIYFSVAVRNAIDEYLEGHNGTNKKTKP